MDTPSAKRPHELVSPASDPPTPDEKRLILGSIAQKKMAPPTVIAASAAAAAAPDQQDRRDEAPAWAKALCGQISTMNSNLNNLCAKMTSIEDSIIKIDKECAKASEAAHSALQIAKEGRDHADELDNKIVALQQEQAALDSKLVTLENYSRRENLILDGLPESSNELDGQLHAAVQSVFKKMDINDPIRLDQLHRLGKANGSKNPRPIIMKFNWYQDRNRVWQHKRRLKGTALFIREDFCKETIKARKQLLPYARAARIANAKHRLQGDRLVINGHAYTCDTIQDIPPEYDPAKLATREDNSTILFFGKHSFLSNFSHASFKLNDIEYRCSEQFYQHSKALSYNDTTTARKIIQSRDPGDQQRYGKAVKGLSAKTWQPRAVDVMYEGLYAKFSQNPHLAQLLKETQPKRLAESSKDSFWGTGKSLSDKTAFVWDGSNKLGETLMLVRDRLP